MSCGRTIGHGETCQPDYLCGTCERISELEAKLDEQGFEFADREAEMEAAIAKLKKDRDIALAESYRCGYEAAKMEVKAE